jgi:excinuclease ABC subunit B
VQEAYNTEHGITPLTILKSADSIMQQTTVADAKRMAREYSIRDEISAVAADPVVQYMGKPELEKLVKETQKQMEAAAKDLDFIEAARLRDYLLQLKDMVKNK